ncbi:zinc finger C2H2 type [Echinococcus multilocularis]|uniref:Zinc finger C2H2 type n=1 Tax=Echinococcus multilocularis TaxID=6211 RepID=A0A068Y825_ECHMU|nr:zinc finger C2H2 type [Echinococcus multilocularis]
MHLDYAADGHGRYRVNFGSLAVLQSVSSVPVGRIGRGGSRHYKHSCASGPAPTPRPSDLGRRTALAASPVNRLKLHQQNSIPRPQMVYASANGIEVAIDSVTRLSYKSPATVDVLISVDIQQESSWKPFLWKCGLCVAQFTIVEQSSVELIAAHLRLHAELRCCDKCSTVLPNSPLAVDAPDAQQHRCSSLVVSRSLDCSRAPQIPAVFPPNDSTVRLCNLTTDTPSSSWKRFCEPCSLGFSSAAQYQQHLKNVHNKYRFVCPECRTTFSTKGNMTTHFQRVHNQSNSVTCPICSKRISNHFNLDRHIRLVHQTMGRWPQKEAAPTAGSGCIVVTGSEDGDGTAPERKQVSGIISEHGYLLCMASPSPPPQHKQHLDEGGTRSSTSLIVADVNIEPPPRRPKKPSNTDTNANVTHKHWIHEK